MVGEIVAEMDYLRSREQKLRDTNESTNERVKWFAFGTMGMLVGLGAWQVVYLRAYFRYVVCVLCGSFVVCGGGGEGMKRGNWWIKSYQTENERMNEWLTRLCVCTIGRSISSDGQRVLL